MNKKSCTYSITLDEQEFVDIQMVSVGSEKYYYNLGYAECYAWTMYMVNHAYKTAFHKNVFNLTNLANNNDLTLSSMREKDKYNQPRNKYGLCKALEKKGKVKLFDIDAFWNGVAQLGDPIQKWNDKYNYGHSFIFLNYTYDENGDIVGFDFWNKTGFHKDLKSDIESWGTKVRGGNLNDKE